jgi:hypothetical protein
MVLEPDPQAYRRPESAAIKEPLLAQQLSAQSGEPLQLAEALGLPQCRQVRPLEGCWAARQELRRKVCRPQDGTA